jgi:hypothetical protein
MSKRSHRDILCKHIDYLYIFSVTLEKYRKLINCTPNGIRTETVIYPRKSLSVVAHQCLEIVRG